MDFFLLNVGVLNDFECFQKDFFFNFSTIFQKYFWRIKIIFLIRFFILKNFFITNSSLPSQKWKLPEIYAEKKIEGFDLV